MSGKHRPSGLLSPMDNHIVFQLLADRQRSLSTAVVKVFLAPQGVRIWSLMVTGAACLVKDWTRKGFFIQAFDLDLKLLIWEQELYLELNYQEAEKTFHTFEGDTGMVGIHFASEDEAYAFRDAIHLRLQKWRERSLAKQMARAEQKSSKRKSRQLSKTGTILNYAKKFEDLKLDPKKFLELATGKTVKEAKFSKSEIGLPTNMIHVSGLRSSGEIVDNSAQVDLTIANFLRIAGIDETVLDDPARREEIYAFVEENSVLEEMSGLQEPVRRAPQANRVPPLPQEPRPITIKNSLLTQLGEERTRAVQNNYQRPKQSSPRLSHNQSLDVMSDLLVHVAARRSRSNTSAEFDATPQKARAFLVQEDDIYEPIHNVPTVRGNTFITSTDWISTSMIARPRPNSKSVPTSQTGGSNMWTAFNDTPSTPSKDLINFTPPSQRAFLSKQENLGSVKVARIHHNKQEEFLPFHLNSSMSDSSSNSNDQTDHTKWFQPSISPSPVNKMGSKPTLFSNLVSNSPTAVRSTTNPFRNKTDIEVPKFQELSNHSNGHSWLKPQHVKSKRPLPVTPDATSQEHNNSVPPHNTNPSPFQPSAPPPSTGIYTPSAPPLPLAQKYPVYTDTNLSEPHANKVDKTVPPSNGKSNLMAEIISKGGFQGAGLKQVEEAVVINVSSEGNFRGAMELALDMIRNANAMSDESENDEVESTGSWSEEDC